MKFKTFQLVKKDNINAIEQELNECFSHFTTMPETKSYHYFIPLSKTVIAAKRMSYDKNFSLEYALIENAETIKIKQNTIYM